MLVCPLTERIETSWRVLPGPLTGLRCLRPFISVDEGEQRWCSGESACLLPLWPGFNSLTCVHHMWAEVVVGSCPCSKGFSLGPPVFLPLQKPTFLIPIQPGNSGQGEPPSGMSIAKFPNIFPFFPISHFSPFPIR